MGRNWLIWLWRLECPIICSLQDGAPGKQRWPGSKRLRTRRFDGLSPSQAGRGSFSLPLSFCAMQTLSSLDEDHPHGGEQSVLLSNLIRKHLPYRSRNGLDPIYGHLWPRAVTHEITCHSAAGSLVSPVSPCLSVLLACLRGRGSRSHRAACRTGLWADTESLVPNVKAWSLGLSSLIRWDIWRDPGIGLIWLDPSNCFPVGERICSYWTSGYRERRSLVKALWIILTHCCRDFILLIVQNSYS